MGLSEHPQDPTLHLALHESPDPSLGEAADLGHPRHLDQRGRFGDVGVDAAEVGRHEVAWDAVLSNQKDEIVATYDVLTLVEK